MKNKFWILLIAAAVFLTTVIELEDAEARRWRRRRPRRAHTLSPEVDMVVTFGDRVSVFQLVKDKRDFYLHFFNSAGQRKDLALSKANYTFLVSQAQNARVGANSIEDCPRSYIQLEIKSVQSRTCLHSDSPSAKKLTELANTFSAPL
ncbi:MAG: hypothetical protein ABL958_06725 [Bdellovibrionia bacterium]